MASERTTLLSQLDQIDWEREKGGEREKRERERSSHFSLDFPAIGPSNPDEAKGKIDPHFKG